MEAPKNECERKKRLKEERKTERGIGSL